METDGCTRTGQHAAVRKVVFVLTAKPDHQRLKSAIMVWPDSCSSTDIDHSDRGRAARSGLLAGEQEPHTVAVGRLVLYYCRLIPAGDNVIVY